MSKNCIFITFDDAYFLYAKAYLNSLSKNYPDHPLVKVLYVGADSRVLQHLHALTNVEVVEYELDLTQYKEFNLGVVGSPMIYVRFILWSDIFRDYENVIYMDCDMLVMRPFPELLSEDRFLAVSDNSSSTVFYEDKSTDKTLLSLLQADQLDFDTIQRSMINSGVLVVPKKYRTKQQMDLILSLRERYNDYILHSDQSIITIWCALNHIPASLKYEYNFQMHFVQTDAIMQIPFGSIRIIHFTNWKPDKNFGHLVLAADFITRSLQAFNLFSGQSETLKSCDSVG